MPVLNRILGHENTVNGRCRSVAGLHMLNSHRITIELTNCLSRTFLIAAKQRAHLWNDEETNSCLAIRHDLNATEFINEFINVVIATFLKHAKRHRGTRCSVGWFQNHFRHLAQLHEWTTRHAEVFRPVNRHYSLPPIPTANVPPDSPRSPRYVRSDMTDDTARNRCVGQLSLSSVSSVIDKLGRRSAK